ncbi:MAG: hypothetical protein ACKVHE_30545 [Planctomycetales bacterium]|jgi:hypothetical protein
MRRTDSVTRAARLQKCQADLCDLSGRQICLGQVRGSQFVQQDVREAGEQQPELVGSKNSAELEVVLSTAVAAGWISTFQLKIDNV